MMLSRRKAKPASSSTIAPESSGPRCAMAAPILFSNAALAGVPASPAMPHMVLLSLGCQSADRSGRRLGHERVEPAEDVPGVDDDRAVLEYEGPVDRVVVGHHDSAVLAG